jgi:beta-phosphoglucomutase-like phosphatase (HAD superfamily)
VLYFDAVLRAVGLDHLIDQRVDGIDAHKLQLPVKPGPMLFLESARRLGVQPPRYLVREGFGWR